MENIKEIKNLCRVCLRKPADLNDGNHMKILNTTQTKKLISVGHASSEPFQLIHFNDQPPCICATCETELDRAHNFVTSFSESKSKYMELLNLAAVKITRTDEKLSAPNVGDVADDKAQAKCAIHLTRCPVSLGRCSISPTEGSVMQAKHPISPTKVKSTRIEKKPKCDWKPRKASTPQSAVCRLCGKKFSSRPNMLRHIREHQGKRYLCEYKGCRSDFTQRSSLKSHIEVVHEGLRRYRCGVCEMRFSSQTNLTIHLRTHSGERPFACDYCEKSFALKSNIIRHMKVHNNGRWHPRQNKKRFECCKCSPKKYLSSNSSLQRHLANHERKDKNPLN